MNRQSKGRRKRHHHCRAGYSHKASKTNCFNTSKSTSSSIWHTWWQKSWAMRMFCRSSSKRRISLGSILLSRSLAISAVTDERWYSLPRKSARPIRVTNSGVLQRMMIWSIFLKIQRSLCNWSSLSITRELTEFWTLIVITFVSKVLAERRKRCRDAMCGQTLVSRVFLESGSEMLIENVPREHPECLGNDHGYGWTLVFYRNQWPRAWCSSLAEMRRSRELSPVVQWRISNCWYARQDEQLWNVGGSDESACVPPLERKAKLLSSWRRENRKYSEVPSIAFL